MGRRGGTMDGDGDGSSELYGEWRWRGSLATMLVGSKWVMVGGGREEMEIEREKFEGEIVFGENVFLLYVKCTIWIF